MSSIQSCTGVFLCAASLVLQLCACSGDPNGAKVPTDGGASTALSMPAVVSLSPSMAEAKECMEESGLGVVDDGRGGLVSSEELTPEQSDLWQAEFMRCAEDVGMNEPFSDDQLKVLYALEVKNYECLLENGFESGSLPSEQAYLDSWRANRPYDSLTASADNGTLREASAACPSPLWSFG